MFYQENRSAKKSKSTGNVSIVVTNEDVFTKAEVLYYNARSASSIEEYGDLHTYSYKDKVYSFYQERESVRSPKGVQSIIDYVERINPYYILYIGGASIIADILNEFCPVMTISTVFSGIPWKI